MATIYSGCIKIRKVSYSLRIAHLFGFSLESKHSRLVDFTVLMFKSHPEELSDVDLGSCVEEGTVKRYADNINIKE
jgi:hypothetical protein